MGGLDAGCATHSRHTYAPHTHEEFVVQVVDSGAIAFDWDGRRLVAPTGSIILINPGVVHTGAPATDDPVSYSTLYPNCDVFARIREDRRVPRFTRPVVRDEALANRIHSLVHESIGSPADRSVTSRLVYTLDELASRYSADAGDASDDDPRRAVRRASDAMEDRYSERLTLDSLSDIAEVSPFYLVRAFRADTGMTPHVYLSNIRVNHARRLLLSGESPGRVALRVGFCDQSHLNRQFKRVFGVTPGRFQRSQGIAGAEP